MEFSVIIPTYNRAEKLTKSLHALSQQTLAQDQFEVIVVNDGSRDLTSETCRQFSCKFKNFTYLEQENQGQAIARQNGLKKAQGKYVIFLQDDIYASPTLLEQHLKIHKIHKSSNIAVLGQILWYKELLLTDLMLWNTGELSFLGSFKGHQFDYPSIKKNGASFWHFYTSNISLERKTLEQESFSPEFKGYGWEDIELGYRLTKNCNLKLIYNEEAIVEHDHAFDLNEFKQRMVSIGKNSIVFQRLHPELQVNPGQKKRIFFEVVSLSPIIAFLKLISALRTFKPIYYYAISKKYYLKGLKSGQS